MKINLNLFKNVSLKKADKAIDIRIDKNSDIYKKIETELPIIRKAVISENRPFTLAPKGENATLMNFGPYTTVLKNDDLQVKIATQIYEHIYNVRNIGSR